VPWAFRYPQESTARLAVRGSQSRNLRSKHLLLSCACAVARHLSEEYSDSWRTYVCSNLGSLTNGSVWECLCGPSVTEGGVMVNSDALRRNSQEMISLFAPLCLHISAACTPPSRHRCRPLSPARRSRMALLTLFIPRSIAPPCHRPDTETSQHEQY